MRADVRGLWLVSMMLLTTAGPVYGQPHIVSLSFGISPGNTYGTSLQYHHRILGEYTNLTLGITSYTMSLDPIPIPPVFPGGVRRVRTVDIGFRFFNNLYALPKVSIDLSDGSFHGLGGAVGLVLDVADGLRLGGAVSMEGYDGRARVEDPRPDMTILFSAVADVSW